MNRQQPGSPTSEQGFSLVIVFLLSLGVLLTGVATMGRISFGWMGAAWQAQSREAREAAEIGMTRIVSELNRERNRRLLVNASVLNTQNRTYIESSTNEGVAGSFCTTDLPLLSGAFPASADLKAQQIIDTERRFQLVSVTQPAASSQMEPGMPTTRNDSDANGTESFKVTTGYDPDGFGGPEFPGRAGEITITVRGMAYRNNTLIATTTLRRTFEVVPKCCWGSLGGFGAAFGSDTRPCPTIGIGIVGGAAENETGEITILGSAASILTGEGNLIPFVYCIASSTCSVNVNQNLGTSVKIVDASMPSIPAPPITTCLDQNTSTCNLDLDDNGLPASGGNLLLDTGVALSSWPANFQSVCMRDAATPPVTTCSINTLDFGANNRTITFDTRGGPLRIYFPNSQSGSTETIDMRNNGGFIHINTNNSGSVPSSITDFTLFGCQPSASRTCSPHQIVEIGNGSAAALKLFAYFPNGDITIGGNGGFEGVMWIDQLGANGNITFTIPGSGISQVLDLMGMGGTAPTQEFPMMDFVTRATKSLQFF
ncbi:hypothetical protein H8F24_12755 [Synechococcus sp. CBW1002]|uniref:hypothetical protein n=1 Tax=Synechococcus sp. CBW1002 TaxID=1353134 RepID=UPI0018CCEDDF|nr:hypothetical protein [Synechococcus sp. CBW1002]QPN58976.1 hypothetical protein H8F24_12755 [Synechococcus sp. CBW1002]